MAHQQSSPGIPTSIVLNRGKVVRVFYLCVVIFTLINLGIVYLRYTRFSDTEVEAILTRFLGTDSEANLPTYYSSFALLFAGAVAAMTGACSGAAQGRESRHWFGLALLFLAMSVDEVCSVHEFVGDQIPVLLAAVGIALPAWLIWPWVLLGCLFILVMLWLYLPFVLSLPARTRRMLILSGVVFVAGAVGMEIVGGLVRDAYGFTLAIYLCYSLEECLEMLGVAILIHGLTEHLTTQFPAVQVIAASQPSPISPVKLSEPTSFRIPVPSDRQRLT